MMEAAAGVAAVLVVVVVLLLLLLALWFWAVGLTTKLNSKFDVAGDAPMLLNASVGRIK